MFDKTSYEQIPIPADISAAYHRAERRWRLRRERRVMAVAACAAFAVGLSIPVGMHLRAAPEPEMPETPDTQQEERLDVEPAADQDTEVGFLPVYQGDAIRTLPAETEANEALRETFAAYYQVPEDAASMNRYYYNYVDLNGDGAEEIFAVGFGSYLSGTGGGSGLLLSQTDGELTVLRNFTLVNTPVIVSDSGHGGWKDLIFPYAGGGAEVSYMRLSYGENGYPNVPDGEVLTSLDGITGTSILYTDLTAPDAPWLTLEP